MNDLTKLVKVSNFTNEVFDLHSISSSIVLIAEMSFQHTAFHTSSLSRIRPKCGAYWATRAVALFQEAFNYVFFL